MEAQQFHTRYQRLVATEQRQAVLRALSCTIPTHSTVGELATAASALGWADPLGEMTLQDFADALLSESAPSLAAADAEAPQVEEVASKSSPPSSPSDRPRAATPESTDAVPDSSERLESMRTKLDAEEPMSLEEAAEVLVPVVERMETATMQSLEQQTGIGRRKLRFHIGQLVRNEYLERHGMGRGTYYTVR